MNVSLCRLVPIITILLVPVLLLPQRGYAAATPIPTAELSVSSIIIDKSQNLLAVPVTLKVPKAVHLAGFSASIVRSVPTQTDNDFTIQQQNQKLHPENVTSKQRIPTFTTEYDSSVDWPFIQDLSAGSTVTTDISFPVPNNLPASQYRVDVQAYDTSNLFFATGESPSATVLGSPQAVHLDAGSLYLRNASGAVAFADQNAQLDYTGDVRLTGNVCSTQSTIMSVFPQFSYFLSDSSSTAISKPINFTPLRVLPNSCSIINVQLPKAPQGTHVARVALLSSDNHYVTGFQPFGLVGATTANASNQPAPASQASKYVLAACLAVMLLGVGTLLLRMRKRPALIVALGAFSLLWAAPHALANSYSASGYPGYDRGSGTVYLQGANDGVLVVAVQNSGYYNPNASGCGTVRDGIIKRCPGKPYPSTDFTVVPSSAQFIPCSSSATYQTVATQYPAEGNGSINTVNPGGSYSSSSTYGYTSATNNTVYLITCFTNGTPIIQADLISNQDFRLEYIQWPRCGGIKPVALSICEDMTDSIVTQTYGPFTYQVKPGSPPSTPTPSLTVKANPSVVDQGASSTLGLNAQNANFIKLTDLSSSSALIPNASSASQFTVTSTSNPPLPDAAGTYTYSAQACTSSNVCSNSISVQVTRNAAPPPTPPATPTPTPTPTPLPPTVSPNPIDSAYVGESISLSWTSANAISTTITLDNGSIRSFTNSPASITASTTDYKTPLATSHTLIFKACSSTSGNCSTDAPEVSNIVNKPVVTAKGPNSDPFIGAAYSISGTYTDTSAMDIFMDGTKQLTVNPPSTSSGTYSFAVPPQGQRIGAHDFTVMPYGLLGDQQSAANVTVTVTVQPATVTVQPVTATSITRFCQGD